jgi:hypothetical protein
MDLRHLYQEHLQLMRAVAVAAFIYLARLGQGGQAAAEQVDLPDLPGLLAVLILAAAAAAAVITEERHLMAVTAAPA